MSQKGNARRFGGVARLYSQQALDFFNQAHVCVIGLGGVGSWAVEALARTGIGKMTLIDLDNVALSNVNRQQPAVTSQLGMPKVEAMSRRVLDINPDCQLTLIEDFVEENNIEQFFAAPFDFVIDAIDSVRVKAAMAAYFIQHKQPFIVSGGAGGRTDPRQIETATINTVTHDPLLANMRYTLRKRHGFREKDHLLDKVNCVFSRQSLIRPESNLCVSDEPLQGGLACAGFGASMMVTAAFGLACAATTVDILTKKALLNSNSQ